MKKALVIGMGISGKSAAKFLLKKGYSVIGVDKSKSSLEQNNEIIALCKSGLILKDETEPLDFSSIELIIQSPGIPPSNPVYKKALESKVEMIGEIELGARELKDKTWIGITGTNGKTTVTLLITHLLNHAGKKAKALGNVGIPLTESALEISDEIIVAELSSYQLETMQTKVLNAALLLNITPDHLDRYGSMEAYARAKFLIRDMLKPNSPLYLNVKMWEEWNHLIRQEDKFFGEEDLYLEGVHSHDLENIIAAYVICKLMNVTDEQFQSGLKLFNKPSHRVEYVKEVEGVRYFDDSKGTNIDAVICAVNSIKDPIVLIAGGVHKGSSYKAWIPTFSSKVKQIYAIGESAPLIYEELSKEFPVEICKTLEKAVKAASVKASKGDTVLLSPGCASTDMFKDYAHRGNEFKRCVELLAQDRGEVRE